MSRSGSKSEAEGADPGSRPKSKTGTEPKVKIKTESKSKPEPKSDAQTDLAEPQNKQLLRSNERKQREGFPETYDEEAVDAITKKFNLDYRPPSEPRPAIAGDSSREIRKALRLRQKALIEAEIAQEEARITNAIENHLQQKTASKKRVSKNSTTLPRETQNPKKKAKQHLDTENPFSPDDFVEHEITLLKRTKGKKPAEVKKFSGLQPGQDPLDVLRDWFASRGWKPWPFQEEAWAAYRRGESGLVHIPTGAGKTYSAYIGPLAELLTDPPGKEDGLQILFITPLRALTRDIELALKAPVEELGLPLTVESRTGDTTSTVRARQRKNLPHILITTPESLELLLSNDGAKQRFKSVKAVILDEWHEMLSSKRGILVELALARLRQWNQYEIENDPYHPKLRTWALSATIANLNEAAQSSAGVDIKPTIITGQMERPIIIDSLIPDNIETFPWAGHLGSRMLQPLIEAVDVTHSTLIFTNVRSHAEKWYQDILEAKPEWAGLLALHHGSMDRYEREFVERGLKEGFIKIVVCTSSLDLGVDFAPVERVFQIGSPKGIARIIQRAGRAAHRPGASCRITCVPTHALELVEIAAVRDAIARGEVEGRFPQRKPYDVLAQHLVTCAMGGGFGADDFYEEVRKSYAYQDLTRDEFDWLVNLVRTGGSTLKAYPEYHKIQLQDGKYIVNNPFVEKLHRLNVGTITSDSSIQVVMVTNRKRLGTMEEGFLSRLNKGDVFTFAGRVLEFVTIESMIAYVRPSKSKQSNIPRWDGSKLSFSKSLGEAVRATLEKGATATKAELPLELQAVRPILQAQKRISKIPKADRMLCELFHSREGHHLFIFPFEGRFVHEGLAAVLGLRMARHQKTTFQVSVNDYGIEFMSQDLFPFEEMLFDSEFFTEKNLVRDILESMNMSELAKRQFREIARVAGLVYQNYPGSLKSSRQLQTSTSLIYDVFLRFDPENLFLQQSRQEVLEKQFEESRLVQTLQRLQKTKLDLVHVSQPSPLAFPLLVDRIGSHFKLSNETMAERVERIRKQWLR